jgi:hypothetical protein
LALAPGKKNDARVRKGCGAAMILGTFMNFLAQLIFLLFFASIVLEKIVTWIFLSRMRRLHPETWSQLDEPATMYTGHKFQKFLWRKEFNSMTDDRMVVIGRSVRWFWLSKMVLFILMCGFCVYYSWDQNFYRQMFLHPSRP